MPHGVRIGMEGIMDSLIMHRIMVPIIEVMDRDMAFMLDGRKI